MENLNRRRFLGAALGTGAAAAAAGGLAPAAGAHGGRDWGHGRGHGGSVPRDRRSIQLYSLRDVMKDGGAAERMFAFLARIGYTEVEPFGESYGWTAEEFRRVLRRHRLRANSRHGHDQSMFEDDWRETFEPQLEDAATMGQEYTGLAWFGDPYEYDTAQFQFMAERFNEAGRLAKEQYGLKFFYHNHDFEFTNKQPDGRPNYDVLLDDTDPRYVWFELDLYWIVVGGESPVHYMQEHSERIPLYHVKDKTWRDRPNEQDWEDVGPGSIDFPDIFAAGERRHLDKHFIIEHDWPKLSHPGDAFAEHKTALAGIEYLRNVRW